MRYVLAALAAACLAVPAHATEIDLGGNGTVTVYPDMGSCASVHFANPTTFAGSFSAAGALAGPGTIVGAVRGALPIVVSNGTDWYGCLPDGYAGATAGHVNYLLHVSTVTGDVIVNKQCTVTNGSYSCV